MEEIVFLNGKFIPQQKAELNILAPGFCSGWGLFETMRAYHRRIVYFAAHLERLKNSCGILGLKLPYSISKLKELIYQALAINGFSDSYVRLTVAKSKTGTDILIVVRRYKPYPPQKYQQGFRVSIFGERQAEGHLLAHKTTSRIFYESAYAQARQKHFDEALILNSRGYITEGSRSNIFLVKDRTLFTPALTCGCLPGITRKVIFDLARKNKIQVYEGIFTLEDLSKSEEAFLTNSLMGLMPLIALEGKNIGRGRCGKLAEFLIKKYSCLLK